MQTLPHLSTPTNLQQCICGLAFFLFLCFYRPINVNQRERGLISPRHVYTVPGCLVFSFPCPRRISLATARAGWRVSKSFSFETPDHSWTDSLWQVVTRGINSRLWEFQLSQSCTLLNWPAGCPPYLFRGNRHMRPAERHMHTGRFCIWSHRHFTQTGVSSL